MTHLNSDRCNAPAQFSLHRAPHVVHYRPRQYTKQHARYPSRQAPTFKNVVIGSSALRICSWKKYARSPSQPSAGHCAARHRDQHPSLPLQRQNTKERREFFSPWTYWPSYPRFQIRPCLQTLPPPLFASLASFQTRTARGRIGRGRYGIRTG